MSNEYFVKADRRAAEAARQAMEQQAVRWLKPAEGSTYFRILPPHPSMRNPETGTAPFYWHVSLHFGVGPTKRVVVCPRKQTGGALYCPICDYAFGLKNSGHDRAGQELLPSWQAYMNVLLVDSETGTLKRSKTGALEVYVWSCGRGTLDKLFDKIEREEKRLKRTIDITDTDTGYVIELARKGKTRDDTKYDIFLLADPLSISEYVDEWGPGLVDLTRLNEMQPAQTLREMLTGGSSDDPFVSTSPTPKRLPRRVVDDDDEITHEVPVEGEYEPIEEEKQPKAVDAAERLQRLIRAQTEND